MSTFTIYSTETGLIQRLEMRPAPPRLKAPLAYLEGGLEQGQVFIKDGQVKPLPVRPGPWTQWDLASETWIDPRSPEEQDADLAADLAERKLQVHAEILERIRAFRLEYITDLPGQEKIYEEKEREAIHYLSLDPEPNDLSQFPNMIKEIGVTTPTAYQLAQLWANLGPIWRKAAQLSEGARQKAKNEVDKASSIEEADMALSAMIAELEIV